MTPRRDPGRLCFHERPLNPDSAAGTLRFGTMGHTRAKREPAPPGPSLWRVRLATVRSRVILAVIGLTALALTIAGLTGCPPSAGIRHAWVCS